MDASKAKEVLAKLGGKFLPGKGTTEKQAQELASEKGFILKEDGELYRILVEQDLLNNPELAEQGLKVGDEIGLGDFVTEPLNKEEKSEPPAKGSKEYLVKENVRHNGIIYEAGKQYSLDKITAEVFKTKNFIE